MIPLYTKQTALRSFDVNFQTFDDPREIFDRQSGLPDFDASELSASEFLVRLSNGDRTFTAIPAFPSRMFRHGFICINNQMIHKPSDLEGKKIGVQLYTMTAAVWIRSILRDEYGVDLSGVEWVQGGIEHPGTHGTPRDMSQLPATIIMNNTSKSLDQLLVEGDISAIIGADLPPSLGVVPYVSRLFPDYKEREKTFFIKHGIFPIMHLVVIRREIAIKHPKLAKELYNALCDSKDTALICMRASNPLQYMLPWLHDAVQETENILGNDPWPYGVESNRHTLEVLISSLYKDGMINRLIPVDEMFSSVI